MRPFTSTISLEEARRRLDAAVRPISRTERIHISESAGRVAAADVISAIDVPPFALSFWRWAIASVILLPFAAAQVREDAPLIRRHLPTLHLSSRPERASAQSRAPSPILRCASGPWVPDIRIREFRDDNYRPR